MRYCLRSQPVALSDSSAHVFNFQQQILQEGSILSFAYDERPNFGLKCSSSNQSAHPFIMPHIFQAQRERTGGLISEDDFSEKAEKAPLEYQCSLTAGWWLWQTIKEILIFLVFLCNISVILKLNSYSIHQKSHQRNTKENSSRVMEMYTLFSDRQFDY